MNIKDIEKVISEAQETIVRARLVLKDSCVEYEIDGKRQKYVGSDKNTSALRRQSMELTRALAEMRKAK